MTKLWNKLVNTTTEQKIQLTIWIISFVMLIVFVVLAAALTKGTESYANTLAATGLVFGLLLVCALFTTAIFSYKKGKRGGK